MITPSRRFPYPKSIVINGLYDTIEALGLRLDSSNSARGTVVVSDAQHAQSMRIALNDEGPNRTRIEIFFNNDEENSITKWVPVILDNLSGRLQQALQRDDS